MAKGRVMATTKTGDGEQTSAQWRLLGYFAPWLGLFAAVLFGLIVHGLFGTHVTEQTALAAVLLTLCGGGLSGVAWDAGRPRGRHMQVFATLFTAACSVWAVAVTIYGVLVRPVWASLLLLVVFVAAHNIRRALRGDGKDAQVGGVLEHKIAEQKRQIKNPRIDAETGIVKARVIADRENETIADVQKQLPGQIEAMARLPRGTVTVVEDRNDFGAGELQIVPAGALKGIQRWIGPTYPGESITLPVPVGRYVDLQRQQIWFTADEETGRNASHIKLMGVNGAGKSEGFKIAGVEALTRIETVIWASDHVKGMQTFGPMIEYIDWPVVMENGDIPGAKKRALQMFQSVKVLAGVNADLMGRHGFKMWTPEVYAKLGIPLTIVWLEEAADLTNDSDTFVRLTQWCRSLGIIIVWSGQRATWTSLPVDARSQLATEWCFGVQSNEDDAKFGLPESVLDAGANPAAWGNRVPGMNYLVAPGIDEDRWAMQGRTFLSTDDQIADVLARHHGGATLHKEAVAALGEVYARRKLFTPGSASAPPTKVQVSDVTDDEMDLFGDEAADLMSGEGMVELVECEDPDMQVDGTEPIGDPETNISFGLPEQARLSTIEAKAVVQTHLRNLLEAGQDRTRAADVHRMKPETTRSSEWLRKELVRLCEAPDEGDVALERNDDDDIGVFRIVGVMGGVVGSAIART